MYYKFISVRTGDEHLGCKKVLAWLCVSSQEQIICIWPGDANLHMARWCHCHPIISLPC